MKRILTWLMLLSAATSMAQTLKVEGPRVVSTDETFRIVFTADDRMSDFDWPGTADFDVVWGPQKGYSSSTSIINGKRTTSRQETVTYLLQPKATGTFTIAAATAKVATDEDQRVLAYYLVRVFNTIALDVLHTEAVEDRLNALHVKEELEHALLLAALGTDGKALRMHVLTEGAVTPAVRSTLGIVGIGDKSNNISYGQVLRSGHYKLSVFELILAVGTNPGIDVLHGIVQLA